MYINNTIQTTSFWKIYKELQRDVQPILNSISPHQRIKARSFELNSSNMLIDEVKIPSIIKSRKIIKSPTILTQFGIPYKRVSKVEKADILEILSQRSLGIDDQYVQPKSQIRRVTYHEFQGQKQKRLNNLVPHTQVYQHSHEAVIVKKKKINRLKNQYKFLQRSRQRKTFGEKKSKSCPLRILPKITHKRAKTIPDQIYQGPLLPIDFELQRKIALLCFKKRNTLLLFRRRTCIQDRKTFFVPKDKLLFFQETLQQHFKQQEDPYETSGESSPLPNKILQFQKKTLNLKSKTSIHEKPFLTPRYNNNNNNNEYSIFHRKASFNIINKYLQEKQVKNKFCLSPQNKQFPQIQSPTLKEINLYFLSTKRNTYNTSKQSQYTSKQSQYTQQSQLRSQISIHTSRSNGIKEGDDLQLNITKSQQIRNLDLKKLSQNTSIHIKTQPFENKGTKTKQFYLQKLKPYYQ
ncbi:unnamed protein product [Paramecium sonneborni]|uniref:Uncharacterized protein n=1 Tax=Paramecium sonneborni TaxID=65129 RepID=A0A8S1MXK5_9CILI|nr:unnamed protein product [Paramecium sonneborni]